jgi:hypothetical protein
MRWALRPSFGIAFAGVAAAAVAGVIVLNNHSPNSPNVINIPAGPLTGQPQTAFGASTHAKASPSRTLSPATTTSVATPPAASSTGARLPALAAPALGTDHAASGTNGAASGTNGAASGANGAASSSVAGQPAPISGFAPAGTASAPSIVPTPPGAGRKQIQSAQLQLSTPGGRINQVSQELFNVVGFNRGIVQNSQITAAGPNGYAYFQLSIPSANLTQTMSALSTLRYAHVVARTDSTQDITNQYNVAVRKLADARALRTALLKQLAAAVTQAQITSLTAQIHDAEASISSDEAALAALNHQVSFSSVQVQINAAAIPPVVPAGSSSHGFGLGNAWHDSVRVLTVAAGAALIALAVLIPLALVGAFVAWIAYWVRRRRREAALDAAV